MKYVRNIAWILMALGGFLKSPEMVYIALAALLVYYAYDMLSFFSKERAKNNDEVLVAEKPDQDEKLLAQDEPNAVSDPVVEYKAKKVSRQNALAQEINRLQADRAWRIAVLYS